MKVQKMSETQRIFLEKTRNKKEKNRKSVSFQRYDFGEN
jgi:hypothetical protein